MLRLLEVGLFVLPFAVFGLWRLAGGGAPSPALVGGTVGLLLVFAAALVWFSLHDTLPPGQRYIPPRTEDGRIVPGHGE